MQAKNNIKTAIILKEDYIILYLITRNYRTLKQ